MYGNNINTYVTITLEEMMTGITKKVTVNRAAQCIDCNGCKLFVDPKSCAYLQGTEIDYVRQGLNEGFQFNNPNERDKCGCGESFRI
jgi:iron-sulfur cluster assembly accessory protein